MKISTIQTIRKLLKDCSYNWIEENKKAFSLFKKSDYFKYLEESISKKEWADLEEDCRHYANNFSQDIRHLNLI